MRLTLDLRRPLAAALALALAAPAASAQSFSNAAAVPVIPQGAGAAGSVAPTVIPDASALMRPTVAPLGAALVSSLQISPSPTALALPVTPITAGGVATAAGRTAGSLAVASDAAPRGEQRRAGALATLRSLAPRLSGGRIAAALDWVFSGRAFNAAADALPSADAFGKLGPASAAHPKESPLGQPAAPSSPADKKFATFLRAGAQTFYEGRLGKGEYGSAIGLPKRVRPQGELPAESELLRRMELPTLTNPQREEKVVELFQLGGAAKDVVTLKPGEAPAFDRFHTIFRQDAGKGRHNYWVVKPGRRSDKVIVVGAHHDKVNVGEGKIDNWGGATLVANLYQAMRDEETDATYVYIAFSREEEGLIGSDVFVRSLKPEVKSRIKAMLNIDTIGVDGTYSWKNNSARYMLDLIAKVAKLFGLDLKEIYLNGGDSDSSSFKRFAQAMTLFGASPDVIWDILHSPNDTMKAFSLPHYVNAAKVSLALLRALDKEDPPPVKRVAALWDTASSLHPYQAEYLRRLKAGGI